MSLPLSTVDSHALILQDLITKVKEENDEATDLRNLNALAEYIEKDYEDYIKQDPDPLDERHPAKIIEKTLYAETLKAILRDSVFLNHLIYICFDGIKSLDIHVAAARILVAIMPGLESNYLNEHRTVIEVCFRVLSNDEYAEPLHSYMIAILGFTTFSPDIFEDFKQELADLVPIVLEKLASLIRELEIEKQQEQSIQIESLNASRREIDVNTNLNDCPMNNGDSEILSDDQTSISKSINIQPQPKRRKISLPCPSPAQILNDCSNSSWAEMEPYQIGSGKFYPLTNQISQRCIMWFLNQLVRTSEYLQDIYKYDLLKMLHQAINLDFHNDVRLSLEALRTLSMLFYNRKCAFDFYQRYSLTPILNVYKQSVASNGVSNCLRMMIVHDDILLRICAAPKTFVKDIVQYGLWLVERSHFVSRTIAVSFFQFVLRYRIFVDHFDQNDGLHKLMNQLSMIDVEHFQWNPYSEDLNHKKQLLKNIFHTLRVYFFTHLIMKTQRILKSNIGANCDSTLRARLLEIDISDYKTTYDRSSYHSLWMEHKNVLLELMPVKHSWEPVEQFIRFEGYTFLTEFLFRYMEDIREDTVTRHISEILMVCSLMPKFQLFFADKINVPGVEFSMTGMKLILHAISSPINDRIRDVFIHPALLNVIINCACGPLKRPVSKDKNQDSKSSKQDLSTSITTGEGSKKKNLDEEILHKMWSLIRHSNGVMILIDLLTGKTQIKPVYADTVRALTCEALLGLSRCEAIRQIMVKLPIFSDGTLYSLMKAPLMHERQREHVQFSKSCIQLMKNVLGSHEKMDMNNDMETTLEDLKRAEIIANTKIDFHEEQLLQLVHKHFLEKGLHNTALALLQEAKIQPLIDTKREEFEFMSPMRKNKTTIGLTSSDSCETPNQMNGSLSKSLKINRTRSVGSATVKGRSISLLGGSSAKSVTKSSEKLFREVPSTSTDPDKISLDNIVREYFRKKHALCKNPVSLCPSFDFFKPHQCPVLKPCQLDNNLTWRIHQSEFNSNYQGASAMRKNRHFMYSRFRSDHRFRPFYERLNAILFCSSFANNLIYGGTDLGDLIVYDYRTSNIKAHYDLNLQEPVCGLEIEQELLVSQYATDYNLACTLWKLNLDSQLDPEKLLDFGEDTHIKFSKNFRERALGTQQSSATLWDLQRGQVIQTFTSDDSNNYKYNVAVFHPDYNLFLNDGVLWDTRTNSVLYKFDKFQNKYNGVFHPNGRQIVFGSEIWDLNTFKLLKSVPELTDAHTMFNSTGDCLFALYQIASPDVEQNFLPIFQSSFRTFDGFNYAPIATIDVKKRIFDISIDPKCNYISLIEQNKNFRKICSGYEIGRGQEDDDTDDDDDDDDDENDEDSFQHWNDSDDSMTSTARSIGNFSLVDSDLDVSFASTDDSEAEDTDDEEDDEETDDEDDEEEDYGFSMRNVLRDLGDFDTDDDEDDDDDDDGGRRYALYHMYN